MKKKLNLLWNLKFNFFSVAERPLTFFAYFLNAKKVGRRRLVIVPATAGGLPLFPHAASVPAPALAPVRSHFACGETGLAGHRPRLLGLPRKIGRGVSPRETTRCGLSASRPWLRHPAPLFCRPRHGCAAPGPRRQNPGARRRARPMFLPLVLSFSCFLSVTRPFPPPFSFSSIHFRAISPPMPLHPPADGSCLFPKAE